MEQELADLQRGERAVERQPLADRRHQLGHRHGDARLVQLVLEQRLVGRRNVVAEDVLHHLVALVEAVLDERVAGERADDVEARDLGFVGVGDVRIGRRAVARELDAAGFDELARRQRADAGDDAVAFDARLALGRVDDERARLDRLGLGIDEGGDVALVDHALDEGGVGGLRIRIVGDAVDDRDVVVGGERQRVLDPGVAGADDDDLLAVIFVGIVELILDERLLRAGDAELPEIALDADREHDMLGGEALAAGEADLEIAALALDRDDFGVEADVGLGALDALGPGVDHLLARAFGKAELAPERQELGRRHHVLAFLILVDRVVDVTGALEQDVLFAVLGRACGRAQASGARPDDRDRKICGHMPPADAPAAPRKPSAPRSVMQYQIAGLDNSNHSLGAVSPHRSGAFRRPRPRGRAPPRSAGAPRRRHWRSRWVGSRLTMASAAPLRLAASGNEAAG